MGPLLGRAGADGRGKQKQEVPIIEGRGLLQPEAEGRTPEVEGSRQFPSGVQETLFCRFAPVFSLDHRVLMGSRSAMDGEGLRIA